MPLTFFVYIAILIHLSSFFSIIVFYRNLVEIGYEYTTIDTKHCWSANSRRKMSPRRASASAGGKLEINPSHWSTIMGTPTDKQIKTRRERLVAATRETRNDVVGRLCTLTDVVILVSAVS